MKRLTQSAAGRRAALLLTVGLVLGCARIQPPPGEAPDADAPQVRVLSPAPGSRGVPGDQRFHLLFNEYVDRATVRSALSLNPRPEGELELDWRGRHLWIRPDKPLAAGRTWTLELGTGLRDLAGNHLPSPLRIPFSTGEELDTLSLELRVEEAGHDGLTQVWLWPLADSPRRAFGRAPWRSSPDEQGRVRFEGLPAGRWLALAVEDLDRNGWWDPRSERAGLPSRTLLAPDSLARLPVLLRLTKDLWTDSLSLDGGQFLDRERVEFRGWLEAPALADWADSLRDSHAADSLRLELLELLDSTGRRLPLAGLAPQEQAWRLYLAEPADSLPHALRLRDGSDSLSLRPPAGPLTEALVNPQALAQGWGAGRLTLRSGHAVLPDATRVRQVVEQDTLAVRVLRRAADRLELVPAREGGQLRFERGFLTRSAQVWPDSLFSLPVPTAPADPPRTGGLQWNWNRAPLEVGWRLVIRGGAERESTAGLEQTLDRLPVGPVHFALYQDRDGSGAWSPGRLVPYQPAEPWQALADTVDVLPGWIQGGIVFQLPEWIP